MLIKVVNVLIINVLQKYELLEIRCGVLLDCRGHQRARISGAALLGKGSRALDGPPSLPTLTISPSFARNVVGSFWPDLGEKSWPSLDMTANQFQFSAPVDQCPSNLFETRLQRKTGGRIHGFTSEYLSTQLADEQLGGHFFTTPCIRQIHRKTCASTPINVILPGEVLTIFSSSNQFFPKAKRLSRLVR